MHVIIGLFLPSVGAVLLAIGGLFYLVWFPLLARDFFRLAKSSSKFSDIPWRTA